MSPDTSTQTKKRSNISRSVRAADSRAGQTGRRRSRRSRGGWAGKGNVWAGRCRDGDTFLGHINHQRSLSLSLVLSIPDRILCSLFLFHSCGDESEPDEVCWRHRPSPDLTDSLTADDFPSQYLSYLFGFDSSLHGFRVSFSCAHWERWSFDRKWWQEFWFSDSKWKHTITLLGGGVCTPGVPLGPQKPRYWGKLSPKKG